MHIRVPGRHRRSTHHGRMLRIRRGERGRRGGRGGRSWRCRRHCAWSRHRRRGRDRRICSRWRLFGTLRKPVEMMGNRIRDGRGPADCISIMNFKLKLSLSYRRPHAVESGRGDLEGCVATLAGVAASLKRPYGARSHARANCAGAAPGGRRHEDQWSWLIRRRPTEVLRFAAVGGDGPRLCRLVAQTGRRAASDGRGTMLARLSSRPVSERFPQ